MIEDFFENQVDLVADSPMINNREEADVVANSHGDELSEIHNALQLQVISWNKIYIIQSTIID